MEDAPEGLPSEQHRLPMGVPSKGRMSTTVSAPQSTGYDEGEGNVPEAQENTRGRRIQGVGAERFVRRQLVKALISNDRLTPKADRRRLSDLIGGVKSGTLFRTDMLFPM